MGAVLIGKQRGDTFAGYNDLEVTVCTCGVLFAMPKKLLDERRYDGANFYCPHGHSLSFDGDQKRLKRQLENERDRAARLSANLDQSEASRRAYKGQATKLKKRASAGVCPCCQRSFKELKRHMETKHPDFVKDAAP